jgi:uncharacterized SAM-binding protein YcdF (DUF218 family)
MFFFLSKLIVFLLSPLTWAFALFLAAAYFFREKRGRQFLIQGLIFLYIFSNSFIRKEVYRIWEYPFTHPVGTYDYAIVLGGFSSFDYDASRIKFTAAGDRFFQAYQLYELGKINKMLISGGSGEVLHPERTESDKVRDFVLSLHVPEQDIIMEKESRNTHENAVNTARWLKENNASGDSLLLITSATHMRRALGCYQKEGLKVVPYTTDRDSEPRAFDPENLFVPDPDNLHKWIVLIKEIVGIAVYKIAGYI